jgi:hypothetical protein
MFHLRKLKTLKVGLEVIDTFFKMSIHKNIAMKIALGIHLLMKCSVKIASQMVQV